MPAVTQRWKGVEKHIDRHTSAYNTELGDGTPWVFSPDRKLSLAPDTFLLHSRAPDLHWTFLDLPEHRCYYLSLSPLFQRAFFPGQGIPDEPPNVLPVVRVPGRERSLLETIQLAIGEFITDSSQGLTPSPRVWGWKALSPSSLGYLLGTIISWHKWIGYTVGSWCKRIGYTVARQFLLA